jgi:hypothetical protein
MRGLLHQLDKLIAKGVGAITVLVDRRIERKQAEAEANQELIRQKLLDAGMYEEAESVDKTIKEHFGKLKAEHEEQKKRRDDRT